MADDLRFSYEQTNALKNVVAAANQELISAMERHANEVIKSGQQAAISKEKANRWWQVAILLLTTGIGLLVFLTQTNIQNKVEDNNRMISTRLALREEFYRRRLTTYSDTCKHLANLRESLDLLEQGQVDPIINEQAADNINAVDRLRKSEFLYMSDELVQELGDLWGLAVDRMRAGGEDGAAIMDRITKQVSALEARMKADLQTREIGQVP